MSSLSYAPFSNGDSFTRQMNYAPKDFSYSNPPVPFATPKDTQTAIRLNSQPQSMPPPSASGMPYSATPFNNFNTPYSAAPYSTAPYSTAPYSNGPLSSYSNIYAQYPQYHQPPLVGGCHCQGKSDNMVMFFLIIIIGLLIFRK